MIHTGDTLSFRVAKLERQNRLLTMTVAATVVALLLAATGEPDIVRAYGFELLDASGKVRAELAATDEAVGLFIKDDEGTTRIGIAQFAHGGGGVALHGRDSKGAAVLYLKDTASLRFFDVEGNVTNQLLAVEANDP